MQKIVNIVGLMVIVGMGNISAQCDYSFIEGQQIHYICPQEIVDDTVSINVFKKKLSIPDLYRARFYTDTVKKEILKDVISFPEYGWYDTAFVFLTLNSDSCNEATPFISLKYIKAKDTPVIVDAPNFANSGDTIVLKPSFLYRSFSVNNENELFVAEEFDSIVIAMPNDFSNDLHPNFEYISEESGCIYNVERNISIVQYEIPEKPRLNPFYSTCFDEGSVAFDKKYVFFSDYTLMDALDTTDLLNTNLLKTGKNTLYVCNYSEKGLSNPVAIVIEKKPQLVAPYLSGNKQVCANDTVTISAISDNTIWIYDSKILQVSRSIDTVLEEGEYIFGALVSENGCTSDTSFHQLQVKPTPTVNYKDVQTCKNNSPILLNNVFPNSTNFKGKGVLNDTLYIDDIGVGKHTITFIHENDGCIFPDTAFVSVGDCDLMHTVEINLLTSREINKASVFLYTNNISSSLEAQVELDSLQSAMILTTAKEIYLSMKINDLGKEQTDVIYYYGNNLADSYPIVLNKEYETIDFYDSRINYTDPTSINQMNYNDLCDVYRIDGVKVYGNNLFCNVEQELEEGLYIIHFVKENEYVFYMKHPR